MPSSLRTTRARRRCPRPRTALAVAPPGSLSGWWAVLAALAVLGLLDTWVNHQWTSLKRLARAYQFEAYVAARSVAQPGKESPARVRPPLAHHPATHAARPGPLSFRP